MDAVILQLEQRIVELEQQYRILENARTADNGAAWRINLILFSLICRIVEANDEADTLEKLANNKTATDAELADAMRKAFNFKL